MGSWARDVVIGMRSGNVMGSQLIESPKMQSCRPNEFFFHAGMRLPAALCGIATNYGHSYLATPRVYF